MRASDEWLDCFLDDEADQIVWRVVAARSFPCEGAEADLDVVPDADDLLFEKAFVNRAELLNAQIAVVDVATAFTGYLEREQRR